MRSSLSIDPYRTRVEMPMEAFGIIKTLISRKRSMIRKGLRLLGYGQQFGVLISSAVLYPLRQSIQARPRHRPFDSIHIRPCLLNFNRYFSSCRRVISRTNGFIQSFSSLSPLEFIVTTIPKSFRPMQFKVILSRLFLPGKTRLKLKHLSRVVLNPPRKYILCVPT